MTPPQSDTPQTYLSTCPACEGVLDVTPFEPYSKVTCPHCGQAVRVRRKFDHFSILKQLGEGGMSRVFGAEDATLGRHVALKILNRHYSKDSVRMASFEREAQLTAAVTHPNVVKLYSVGRDQGNFYIAMELVGGGSLEGRIVDQGRLSEADALHVGRMVAEGLRAAYREGLIHRDVKPANILFTDEGTPKIVDFGLALFHERDKDDSGEIWATPFYVAPEKVRDDTEDFRSDMYSLGATLYHALVGKPPHQANTNSIAELKIIKSKPVKLEDSGFKFSSRTCELVNRMLALKPADRHQTYDALVDAFRDAESLLGYSVIGRRSRRQKLVYAIGGAVVVTILLALLLRPRPQVEMKSVEITQGTDEAQLSSVARTLSSGTTTIADVFTKARNLLFEGKFAESRKLFDEIIAYNEGGADRVKQPTLNKTRFNAALCAIFEGRKDAAQRYFRAIKKDSDEGTMPATAESSEFFSSIAERMAKDLALELPRTEVNYDGTTEAALGFLAHGLAQWHFGKDPDVAMNWLREFQACAPTRSTEWLPSYQKLISPYSTEYELAGKLGDLSNTPFGTTENARLALVQVKAVLADIKLPGALKHKLEDRSKFAQQELNRLRRVAEEAERARISALRQRELAQLKDLNESLPSLVRGYDYSQGVELLESMNFQTPEVQNAIADRLYLWSKAREFMTTLMADVTARGYSGTLARRTGIPLQGRLTHLGYDTSVVSLERGQVSIETDTLTPDLLITVAQNILEGVTDSTDYYRRQELIVVFAKMQGLYHIVSPVASQLMEENRAFRQRWARVEQSGM
ncbi:serine/threonine protein kinase [Roseimicrobium gellanilyticum]|uniref:Serine/threonine protein kinase n=1 Tax=Roseimicrobium gellanilyticum TaxID=748857 RepID=A0A366HQ10_9BACT|nr:serine/threonine-protein kinase [Roseimicrobium gellanilyticum]RBP45730.1 serine/threonine protein kinase [Roseimicrobium gellanilyticum]